MSTADKLSISLVIIIMSIMVFFVSLDANKPDVTFEEEVYVIEPGDSLWEIAGEYCPQGMDKREYIRLVRELNELDDCTIFPGQEIIILTCVSE